MRAARIAAILVLIGLGSAPGTASAGIGTYRFARAVAWTGLGSGAAGTASVVLAYGLTMPLWGKPTEDADLDTAAIRAGLVLGRVGTGVSGAAPLLSVGGAYGAAASLNAMGAGVPTRAAEAGVAATVFHGFGFGMGVFGPEAADGTGTLLTVLRVGGWCGALLCATAQLSVNRRVGRDSGVLLARHRRIRAHLSGTGVALTGRL